MRVKILTSCAGLSFSYYEGEAVEVSAKLGKDLVKAGFAEKTTLPKTSVQAASSSASSASSSSSGTGANASPGADSEPGIEDGESGGKCGCCKC